MATISRPGFTIHKSVFEVEPGIVLPALDITAARHSQQATPVVRIGVNWERDLATDQAIEELVRSSERVLLVNPRGMGETDPVAVAGRRGSPFGHDVQEAFLSIHLARSLLGQRAADILAVLEGLTADSGARPGFSVVGVGAAGPIVLHAALLDDKGLIKDVVLERSLVSWSDVVEKGISRDQLGNVVPGALQVYDLPDLAARLAPRPLRIQSPVDATGQPISLSEIQRAYAACIKAYGSSNRLELRGDGRREPPAR